MATYQAITCTCQNCKEPFLLFPRSIRNGRNGRRMVANYLTGWNIKRVVFYPKTNRCLYDEYEDTRLLCEKCAQEAMKKVVA